MRVVRQMDGRPDGLSPGSIPWGRGAAPRRQCRVRRGRAASGVVPPGERRTPALLPSAGQRRGGHDRQAGGRPQTRSRGRSHSRSGARDSKRTQSVQVRCADGRGVGPSRDDWALGSDQPGEFGIRCLPLLTTQLVKASVFRCLPFRSSMIRPPRRWRWSPCAADSFPNW